MAKGILNLQQFLLSAAGGDIFFCFIFFLSTHPPTPSLFSVPRGLFMFCFVYSFVLIFKIPHISEIIYLPFSVWFISLSIVPSRSIHGVAHSKISFFFMAE